MDDSISREYVKRIRQSVALSSDEEFTLAREWKENKNAGALERIVQSHLKLSMKVAYGYRGYGLPLSDLISEAQIGIMQALNHFDPSRGFRFSTYAIWWIRSAIHEYIFKMWSFVKMGTTKTHRKLFFKLRQEQERYKNENQNTVEISEEMVTSIAKTLNVEKDEILFMHQRLRGKDHSLNTRVSDEGDKEWIDWVHDEEDDPEIKTIQSQEATIRYNLLQEGLTCLNQREHDIFTKRRLNDDPPTLDELAAVHKISRERVRQIEKSAFEKVQKEILKRAKDGRLLC